MTTATAPAGRATRATYKGHNRPTGGFYFGGRTAAGGPGRLVTFRPTAGGIAVHDATTGEHIADHRGAALIWYAPATTVDTSDMHQARVDVAHIEADLDAYWRWSTSGRSTDAGIALVYSRLAVERCQAAKAGHGALALALAERIAELQPAYDAHQAEQDRLMEAQKAEIIALRAAEAGPDEVVIVPCGGRKLDRPAPAGELYTGSYHQACRRAAAARGGRLLILSALHGLLDPSTVVAPYDLRMGQPGSVTPRQVRDQAGALGILGARVTVLAGKRYADVVRAVWPDADRPLAGTRGIGDQLAALAAIASMPRPRPHRRPAPARRPRRGPRALAGQLELFAA